MNSPAPAPAKAPIGSLRALWPFVHRHLGLFTGWLLALACSSAATLSLPVAFRTMIDDGFSSGANIDRTFGFVLVVILVLAVAQEADRDSTKPKVVNAVTLEVTPREAEVLDLARSVGTLSLVLRNPADPARTPTAGATKNELLGMAGADKASAPAPRPARVVRAAKPPPPAPAAPPPAAMTAAAVAVDSIPAPAPRACVDIVRGTTKVTECF